MFEGTVWLLRLVELSALAYLLLIAAYTWGWRKLSASLPAKLHTGSKVSVVVALRNESQNVEPLVRSLLSQQANNIVFDLLFVDDHSTDDTLQLLQSWAEIHSERIKVLKASGEGKKAALRQAIEASDAEIILTTDADCRPQPFWLAMMVAPFGQQSVQMMLGPVRLEYGKNLFEKLQALEFCSLMGATGGAAALHKPSMANGANLAFRRNSYLQAYEKQAGQNFASGDDLFLLNSFESLFGAECIGFCNAKSAIVSTNALSSFKDFVSQRIRWVSKSSAYRNLSTLIPAWVVFIFNFFLIAMMIAAFILPWMIPVFVLFFILKAMADFPLVRAAAMFNSQKNLLWLFVPLSLIYPFYVFLIPIIALIFTTEWKGRRLKS